MLCVVSHDRRRAPTRSRAGSFRSLKNRLPEKIKSALNEAEFTLLSLNPNPAPESESKSKETFHNYEVLGKTVVRDCARAELLNNGISVMARPFAQPAPWHQRDAGREDDRFRHFSECQFIRTYAGLQGASTHRVRRSRFSMLP